MLILLPPSEGKTSPSSGRPLDLDGLLGGAELGATRLRVMEALAQASASPEAAVLLGLGPRSAADAALNLRLTTAPCAPAHELFTGVLYEAAALAGHARGRSGRSVLSGSVVILSGLWGAVRATDALPDHRLSMGLALPGLGRMSTFWKRPLAPVLDELADGVVVDCRSSAYAAAWQPSTQAPPTSLLKVTVVKEAPNGRRTVVSHHAKHTRGLLVGALIAALAEGGLTQEADAEAVAAIAQGLEGVHAVELEEPDRRGRRDLRLVLR
ncbi:YaaA family protein [Actinomyces bowdenii]|uniref:YaaA family protein n=1 Tax=Actinomyces bowdenii TaxID=131109 RepID=UPI0035A2EC6A